MTLHILSNDKYILSYVFRSRLQLSLMSSRHTSPFSTVWILLSCTTPRSWRYSHLLFLFFVEIKVFFFLNFNLILGLAARIFSNWLAFSVLHHSPPFGSSYTCISPSSWRYNPYLSLLFSVGFLSNWNGFCRHLSTYASVLLGSFGQTSYSTCTSLLLISSVICVKTLLRLLLWTTNLYLCKEREARVVSTVSPNLNDLGSGIHLDYSFENLGNGLPTNDFIVRGYSSKVNGSINLQNCNDVILRWESWQN